MHINLRGFVKHKTELEYQLANANSPDIVGISESFLDRFIPSISLSGYVFVSRLDHRDGRDKGGIAMFAKSGIADRIVHLADSDTFERSWHILHTSQGPILICLWYRPP